MADTVRSAARGGPADAVGHAAGDTARRLDLFDYGADDIAVEVPTEWVHVTDAFAVLLAG